MSGIPMDKVDFEARRKAAKIIYEKFQEVAKKVLKGEPPELKIPKRTLANVKFDPEKGILVMGEDYVTREFLNMGEARRFMQTLLMAAIIYQALVENEYPTIRDLYYRGKHTIAYRDLKGRLRQENTWEEQSESDAAIRDVEVFTGLLREDMLILSKEKGKVVGRMRIRSGDDIIDLSKMGHGAYAIESTPDLIEFIDVDAEFVLVVEKDAVFQQLHRIKFWDKYKAILVT
jgi:DNA topoisomerase-6 subunit A